MATTSERLQSLFEAYGIPAANAVCLIRQSEDTIEEMSPLISGHDALKKLLADTDFLKRLCEDGGTDQAKKTMEEAWKQAGHGLDSLQQCIGKDHIKTQGKLAEHADKVFRMKANELEQGKMLMEGIRVIVYFAQCAKLEDDLATNGRSLVHIRDDLTRFHDRYIPGVLTMLRGGEHVSAERLEEAMRDLGSVRQRLEEAKDTAATARNTASFSALSSSLDLLSTIRSVHRTWSALTSASKWMVGAKAACQFAASAYSVRVAHIAQKQVVEIDLLIADVDGYIAKIDRALAKVQQAKTVGGGVKADCEELAALARECDGCSSGMPGFDAAGGLRWRVVCAAWPTFPFLRRAPAWTDAVVACTARPFCPV
eukprot:CAMPEP_0171240630 /NCGR_PEP_ID=MMETSP0790-20130122/44622_1 /TAXON_ID=2925 /ORGANISM="Alexandrium catenella, Strain OF101" /LENGTH=368 /DNA_ID=CAMNT_0011707101 /DNA_START=87 /DNA_END=1188 /DNA_ORIENTATION=-